MGRIVAFDWGTKRIGVSVSDEEQILAHQIASELKNDEGLHSRIEKLFREYQPEKILVGLPKSLAGELAKSAREAEIFGRGLSQRFNLPVEFLDERFTSKLARQKLKNGRKFSQSNRIDVDNTVAQTILQEYLDRGKTP